MSVDRTRDLQIFSLTLSQLSYPRFCVLFVQFCLYQLISGRLTLYNQAVLRSKQKQCVPAQGSILGDEVLPLTETTQRPKPCRGFAWRRSTAGLNTAATTLDSIIVRFYLLIRHPYQGRAVFSLFFAIWIMNQNDGTINSATWVKGAWPVVVIQSCTDWHSSNKKVHFAFLKK